MKPAWKYGEGPSVFPSSGTDRGQLDMTCGPHVFHPDDYPSHPPSGINPEAQSVSASHSSENILRRPPDSSKKLPHERQPFYSDHTLQKSVQDYTLGPCGSVDFSQRASLALKDIRESLYILEHDVVSQVSRDTLRSLWPVRIYPIVKLFRLTKQVIKDNHDDLNRGYTKFLQDTSTMLHHTIGCLTPGIGAEPTQLVLLDAIGAHRPRKCKEHQRVVYQLLVYSSDVERYLLDLQCRTDRRSADDLSRRASQLAPRMGQPYHQLALLSELRGASLEAMFGFARCLLSQLPVVVAKENFTLRCEEYRQKYEKVRMRIPKVQNLEDLMKRGELWIVRAADGLCHQSVLNHRDQVEQFDAVSEVPSTDPSQNNKMEKQCFIYGFMSIHALLCARIDLFKFSETEKEVGKSFRAMLSRCQFEGHYLLKFFTISLMALHTSVSASPQNENNLLPPAVDMSLSIAFLMFSEICRYVMRRELLDPDVSAEYISALRFWLIMFPRCLGSRPWMQSSTVWQNYSMWLCMCSFISDVMKVDTDDIVISDSSDINNITVLPEDLFAHGMKYFPEITCFPKDVPLALARVHSLQGIVRNLCIQKLMPLNIIGSECHVERPPVSKYPLLPTEGLELTSACSLSVTEPRAVVFDTNCYVSYLESVKEIVASSRFSVFVPQIVLQELHGLSKDVTKANMESFKEAYQWICERIQCHTGGTLELVSSAGAPLRMDSLEIDYSKKHGENDDKILHCCIMLEKRDSLNEMALIPGSSMVALLKRLVLVTEDRVLRAKSRNTGVACATLQQFLKLAYFESVPVRTRTI